MNLQFFLSDKLIDTVPIDYSCMNNPLYLPRIKSELQEKHKEVIEASNATPTFYVQSTLVNDRRGALNGSSKS